MSDKKDYVAQESFAQDTQRRLSRNEVFVGTIALVTLVSFLTLMFALVSLILTYQKDNSQVYMEYRDEVRLQNSKIDDLIEAAENRRQIIPESN